MPGCDVADLVGVAQGRRDLVDLVVFVDDQMETAGNEIDARVDLRRRLDDFVDAWMRATDDDHRALGRIERERELAQLERSGLIGHQGDQMDSRRDLGGRSMSWKFASGHAAPKRIVSGGAPS